MPSSNDVDGMPRSRRQKSSASTLTLPLAIFATGLSSTPFLAISTPFCTRNMVTSLPFDASPCACSMKYGASPYSKQSRDSIIRYLAISYLQQCLKLELDDLVLYT